MLFNSSIRKELARTYAATLAVLLTIVITVMLIRTLAMASRGSVSPQDVMIVLSYVMLGYIPILLSMALFLSIVFVLARMYRDSEMVIWQSAGVGLLHLIKPVLLFTWPIVTGIAVLMLFAWPWSNSQITYVGLQFQQRSEISRIQPGQFQISSNGKHVVFIEQQSQSLNESEFPQGKNAFLYTNDLLNGKVSIITAKTAHAQDRGNDRFLILSDGQQLEFNQNNLMRTLLTFETYAVLVGEDKVVTNPAQKAKELPTEELLSDPTPANMGELSWRLGLIAATINLILIAIPLGHANPRTGRNTNLLYALLTFVIYFNLINLGRSWISSDKYGIWSVMLVIHGAMFGLAIFFMLKQHYAWVFLPQTGFRRSSKKKVKNQSQAATTLADKNETHVNSLPTPAKKINRRRGWGRLATVKRLFYMEIFSAIILVSLGFLSLFFFFDFIDDLGDMARKGYQFQHVMIRCLLLVPEHLYELMPIVVLIGTIFVLSRMAQSSEFTILRTSGLSPIRALRLLTSVGLAGALLTFVLGDIIIPQANRASNSFMERFYISQGSPISAMRAAWLKDHDENYSYAVSVFQNSEKKLSNVHLYAFDADNRLVQWVQAPTASINSNGTWTLENANRSTLVDTHTPLSRIVDEPEQNIVWQNNLNANVVSIATFQGSGMTTLSLYRYIEHLELNAQSTNSYVFTFWQKLFYPLSCLVMVMLALPFAYLHFRSGGISTKVFGGIMIGISFVVINNMFGHLGQLRHWAPIVSAGMPSLIYLIASLATFTWLVRNR